MVGRKKILWIMLGYFLSIIYSYHTSAQTDSEYEIFKNFRKWSFVAGPVLYDKASIEVQYGQYIFLNKPMWTYTVGIEKDYHPDKKWAFVTGLFTTLEPVHNIDLFIKEDDIYPQYKGNYEDNLKMYSMNSFSMPLLARLKIRLSSNIFVNFRSGFRIKFYPSGTFYTGVYFSNKEHTESKEMFGVRGESPDNNIQASFLISSGFNYVTSKLIYKLNWVYNINFQNNIDGKYLFDNMLVSERSYGYYKLSGNYLGFLFSVTLAKHQKKEFD